MSQASTHRCSQLNHKKMRVGSCTASLTCQKADRLVASLLSVLSVFSILISCCKQGMLQRRVWMGECESLPPGIVVPEVYQNDHSCVHNLSGCTFDSLCKNLTWQKVPQNHKNVKIGGVGNCMAQALAQDTMVHEYWCLILLSMSRTYVSYIKYCNYVSALKLISLSLSEDSPAHCSWRRLQVHSGKPSLQGS